MNTTYAQEQASLACALRERILEYKKARPNLSSQQIATKFGMSSSTFNRIENLDIKTPTFDQVIKVFNGTGCRGDLLAYLKGNYPELSEVYMEAYTQPDSAGFIDADILKYLVDEKTSKLMLLAFSKCGLSKEIVKDEFGNEGIRTLDYLLGKGALVEKEKRFFPRDKGVMVSQKDTKTLCENALKDYYDLRGFEEARASNFLSFQSESIDLDRVYPQVISLLREVNKRVRDIFNNPENFGEDTVFVSLASDTILPNNLRERQNISKRNLQ